MANAEALLYTIARNYVRNLLRQRRRLAALPADLSTSRPHDADAATDCAALRARLDPTDLVLLDIHCGLRTVREAAVQLGISKSTAHRRARAVLEAARAFFCVGRGTRALRRCR